MLIIFHVEATHKFEWLQICIHAPHVRLAPGPEMESFQRQPVSWACYLFSQQFHNRKNGMADGHVM